MVFESTVLLAQAAALLAAAQTQVPAQVNLFGDLRHV